MPPDVVFDTGSFGKPAYEVVTPDSVRGPLVLNSPHSGACYPAEFLAASRLDPRSIRRSEDFYVDEIVAEAARLGCPLVKANFPRAWLDVNREPYELDPKMFDGTLPTYANVRSVRVAGGLGTVARIVSESEEIYPGLIGLQDVLTRIDTIYKPYHRALRQQVLAQRARFGFAVLIDCHSMPSTVRGMNGRTRPDIVIGDRYGTSCASELTDFAGAVLTRLGYSVSRNKPYAGGFITEHYGQPARGLHAMQIELNRALYMDERSLARTRGFATLQADMAKLVDGLFAAFDAGFLAGQEAAE